MAQETELLLKEKYRMSENILKEVISEIDKTKFSEVRYYLKKYDALSDLVALLSAEGNYKDLLNVLIDKADCIADFALTEILFQSGDIMALNQQTKLAKESIVVNKLLADIDMDSYLKYFKKTGNENYALAAIYFYRYLTKKENGNEDAFRTRSPGLPPANFRARIRLAPDAIQELLRTACDISQGHHHSLWVSLHADPSLSFCLGLPACLQAAQREPAVARTHIRSIRRRTLVEFHDARSRGQERNDIGPGLSGD